MACKNYFWPATVRLAGHSFMDKQPLKQQLRSALRWVGWVLLVQFFLLNISAALYADKFTHFDNERSPAVSNPDENIFKKTWRLFAGQRQHKSIVEGYPSFSFDTITLTTKKGRIIDTWYSKTDSLPKGTVILFHGLTMNKSRILLEASEFRHQGYNILLVDFRGHGNSAGNNTSIGFRESEEVKLAWDYIFQQGEKNIFLWGVSLGAVTILKAIADYDIKPAGIILEMPFASLKTYLKARARAIGFRGFPEKPFAFLVTAWIGIERGFNGFNFKTYNYAKKITCPVLFQWGALDQTVGKWETEKVFNSIASSHKKLVIYDQADHESFLQKDPVKWRMETEKFLTASSQ
ncbi:MAG: alpha/beta hydrolase [Chitinophagaceae bacterium]|nr:alpha/beta hydrolase [Chitinophagaceae bacterium]MBL0272616.1 alpha/beta hydrolase [Chitinophagaceae bacterium]